MKWFHVITNFDRNLISLRKHKLFYGLLLTASLMFSFLAIRNPNMGADSIGYLISAYNLLHGRGYTLLGEPDIISSPLYGLLANIINLLVNDIEYSGMITVGLSYLGLIILSYNIGRKTCGYYAGVLSAAFVSLFPALVIRSYVNLADVVYSFFLIAAFGITIEIWKNFSSIRKCVMLGVVLGISSLTRPDPVVIIPFIWLGVFVKIGFDTKVAKTRSSLFKACFCSLSIIIFFLIVVSPYAIFLKKHTGTWTLSNKIGLALLGGGQENPHLTLNMAQNSADIIFNNIEKYIYRINKNTIILVHKIVILNLHALIPLFVLSIIGIVLKKKAIFADVFRNKTVLYLLLVSLIYFMPLLPGLFITPYTRYILPYFIISQIVAGCLCGKILEAISIKIKKNISMKLLPLLIVLIIVGPMLPKPSVLKSAPTLMTALESRHGHLGLRAAGFWLNNNTQNISTIRIASRKYSVPLFYANGKQEPGGFGAGLPKDIEKLKDVIIENRIDYIIFDNHYIPDMHGYKEVWETPSLSQNYGIRLIASKDNLFQIYTPIDF